jgi:hypothetical protein
MKVARSFPAASRAADRGRIPNHKLPRRQACRYTTLYNSDHSNSQIVRIPHCSLLSLEKGHRILFAAPRKSLDSQKMETALGGCSVVLEAAPRSWRTFIRADGRSSSAHSLARLVRRSNDVNPISQPTRDHSPLASSCLGNRGRLDARQYTTALEHYFPTLPVPAAKGTNYGGRADIAEWPTEP